MIREYKIASHNSTVNGYPGKSVDWSLFDWKGGQRYDNKHGRKGTPDFYLSLAPGIDDYLIGTGNQYLHVAYNWISHCTIYRVRPADSMLAGQVYRGMRVIATKAIKKADGWYWQLALAKEAR